VVETSSLSPQTVKIYHQLFGAFLLDYDPDYLWTYEGAEEGSYESEFVLSETLQNALKLWLAPLHIDTGAQQA
jgi:hypothetical protein